MTDNNLTFRRKERKFLVVEHSFDELVEALSDHIPVNIYHGNSPCCRIQTIYLDTVDHALYHEYLLRREFRFKIRLRRYGYDGEFQEYYLVEIKAKNNGISNKKRFILPGECLQDFLSGADIKKQIKAANKGLKGAQKTYKLVRKLIALNSLVPVMETSYDRVAFQKKSRRVRITIDRNITHKKLLGNAKNEHLDAVILESKIMGKTPKWHKKLVNRLSLLRQDRFSKYATGINALYFPARGKYNFTDENIGACEMPEVIQQSYELMKDYLKLESA
jgi:SPX domain protein involved in polyphosphate accumulation